jgi:hypothetical protein
MTSNYSSEHIELTPRALQPPITSSDIEYYNEVRTDEGFSLPPTDGGKDAWLCLLACFMLEAMIWGERCQTRAFCVRSLTYQGSRPPMVSSSNITAPMTLKAPAILLS